MEQDFSSVQKLYEHLQKVVSSEAFLKNAGINHEVPFFICPYKSAWKEEIEGSILPILTRELEQRGISVLSLNLYDLAIDILKENELLEAMIDAEKETDKEDFLENLQGPLDVREYLVPKIKEQATACSEGKDKFVLFLSGVGEVFPYIRAHTLLNNLQSVIKDFPLVLFFPGKYETSPENGYSMSLFDRLPADNYYRAYNILNYKI